VENFKLNMINFIVYRMLKKDLVRE